MNVYIINNKSRIEADTEREAITYYKKMYDFEFKTITMLTKKEQLIDEMVSCYDNGEAMFDLAEEYFKQRTCENCKHYKEKNKQCLNETSIAYTSQEAIYCDDGCNKWEEETK